MGIEVYLGEPPKPIKDWIINNSKPVANPKTKITFADGSVEEYNWSGEITLQTMIDAGLYDINEYTWVNGTYTIEIGTNVTSIGSGVFDTCINLTSVTIPDSVTSIGSRAFRDCRNLMSVTIPDSVTSIGSEAFETCINLKSVTFAGKDKATVQGMANYSWELNPGCVIHCTDGDITI